MRPGRNVGCERARLWASLAPDGELSELEQHSLWLHLHDCDSCSRFAREVAGVALLVRSEALERPSVMTVVPRALPRRRSIVTRARPIAAAAAVALMALGVASRAPLPVDERDSGLRPSATTVAPEHEMMRSLRDLRQGAFVAAQRSKLEPLPTLAANEPA
jgi:predicted anti-sigma-YlaC factor YlaD